MSLKSRLERIEASIPTDTARIVLVRALDELDSSPAGTMEPWESDGRNWSMTVPAEFDTDPLAGLTAHQRAFLRPDDKVVVLAYVPHDEVMEKVQRGEGG